MYNVQQKLRNFADLKMKISWIFKIFKKSFLLDANFWEIRSSINLPHGVTRGPTKNVRPIGSAVFAFIGHKRTDKVYI